MYRDRVNNEIKQKLTALNQPWKHKGTAAISLIRKYYFIQLGLIYIRRNSHRIVITSSVIHFQIAVAHTKLGKRI